MKPPHTEFEDAVRAVVREELRPVLEALTPAAAQTSNETPRVERRKQRADGYVSVSAAAKLTDYNEGVIRRHIASNTLRASRATGSREYRIRLSDLHEWMRGGGAEPAPSIREQARRLLDGNGSSR